MWRQQRRNMGQFFLHLGMILGFVWLAFTAAGLLMERFNFSFQTRAIALYEITAWAHFFAAGIYGVTVYRRYQQFWRRDTLPQLLLTGVPPILIVLAIPVYLLFIQAYIALLCLPFYAAAKNLSGIPWSTVLLDASIIALLASLPGSMGMFL
jgi:heme exporter protein D